MFKASVITVSDKGYAGEREDTAGPLAAELLREAGYEVLTVSIVPDERPLIEAELRRHADELGAALVLTTGGTGFARRDVTPEALEPLLEKTLPGIGELIRARGFAAKPSAILSRATAGTRGRALIIALPGNPRGAAEGLAVVWPAVPHALEVLRGEATECGTERCKRRDMRRNGHT